MLRLDRLKAGLNASNAADVDGSKLKWGINAGPVVQISFEKMFFIQPELLYSLKGYQSPTSVPNFSDSPTISLQDINLPVFLGFKAGKNFSIKLGPEIGRLLSARNEKTGDYN